ncbi:hypothetical protein HQ531_13970, partial [bacterium]|nr:hypothetical protein [bacterium]
MSVTRWAAPLIIMLWISQLFSQDTLQINGNAGKISLGLHLATYEDISGEMTLENILAPKIGSQFQVSDVQSPNYGHTSSAIWARFNLQNQTEQDMNWFLELGYPLLMEVQAFLPDTSGKYVRLQSGSMTPFSERPIKHSILLFPIMTLPGEVQTCYVRIETKTALLVDLKLWSRIEFMNSDHDSQFILGIYFGILLIMLFYNLFIYLSLRDSSYLYYVIFVLASGLYQFLFNGLAIEYFWPERPDLNWYFLTIFGGGIVFSGTQFARKILLTKVHSPRLDVFLKVLVWASIIFIIFSRKYSLAIINP